MSQNELQPLHYREAYALLIARVEQVIAQLECGGEDVPPAFICAALVQALHEAEDAACAP